MSAERALKKGVKYEMAQPRVATPRIEIAPPVYFCPRATGAPLLDGNLDKPFWRNVPFTEAFCDISGRDFPAPRFRTRAKMCWDDRCLYVAALLEGHEIWATIRQRDSVIYYDNDFEFFLDPSSSTHNYMELEMNAFNTQWDLMLTQPYRDGGRSVTGWDMKGVETAVRVEGVINDPGAQNRFWSVEMRIPFASVLETYSNEENPPGLERCYPCRTAPKQGEFWRVNFSRVQWHVDVANGAYRRQTGPDGKTLPEDNWVWAPTGLIDIHCPEFWGFVFFTEHGEACEIPENEKRKIALRRLYYSQHAYFAAHGRFCNDLKALGGPALPYPVQVETTSRLFALSCHAEGGGRVCLRSDGFVCIES